MTDLTKAIAGKSLHEWEMLAQRDDCFDQMVPSDLRQILGALHRARHDLSDAVPASERDAAVVHISKQRQFLWDRLDDIDTLDDACRDNDTAFRERARKQQMRRWEISSSDGYIVDFFTQPQADALARVRADAVMWAQNELLDAAKAYVFECDAYDEETPIAMAAWRSARSKLNAAIEKAEAPNG